MEQSRLEDFGTTGRIQSQQGTGEGARGEGGVARASWSSVIGGQILHPYVFRTEWYSLRWENLAIALGILAGLWLAQRIAAEKGAAYQDLLLDLAIWMVIAGVAGARLWELPFTWREYAETPWDRLAVWKGGLSIQGALLGGLAAAVLFALRRRLKTWELLDILAPAALLGQGIGRIGCLLSGDAYGRPIREVPWLPQELGVVYAPETPAWYAYGSTPLVPAEAMEGGVDFLILTFLLTYRPAREVPGRRALLYGLLYSVARLGLEFLRGDSLQAGGLKAAQLLAAATVLLCSVLLLHRVRTVDAASKKAAG